MIDCSAFVKLFNQYLPAPTCSHPTWPHVVRGTPEGSGSVLESAQRVTDATWRLFVTDSSNNNNSNSGISGMGSGSNGSAKAKLGNASFAPVVGPSSRNLSYSGCNVQDRRAHGITIGRIQVSTEDRWRIQANLRKEGEKKGLSRPEYNKAVTRAVINVDGPTGGPGFPPGRGRPI